MDDCERENIEGDKMLQLRYSNYDRGCTFGVG